MSASTTTAPHPLTDRRASTGANRDNSEPLLTDHEGDNLAAAIVYQDYATTKQTHQFLADRNRLWIHDSGMTLCDTHASHYLAAAITNHPRRALHPTPRGSWERYDGELGITCEICHPIHIG